MILAGGLAVGASAAEERKAMTQAEVEGWEEYTKAPLTKLVEVPKKKWEVPKKAPLGEDILLEGEAKLRSLARRLELPVTQPLQRHEHHDGSVLYHRFPDRSYYSLWFQADGREVSSVRMFDLPMFDELSSFVTPELFEGYARGFYLKAFGVAPGRDAAFRWDGVGIHRFGKESAIWGVSVEGVIMKNVASFSVTRDANEKWTVSCSKGPTRWEIEKMKERLRKQPVKVSYREAMAIAWKNWKAVRKDGYGVQEFAFHPVLRQLDKKELQPFGTASRMSGQQQAWVNPAVDRGNPDRVFYQVQLSAGLFAVDVLVDRGSGEVVRLSLIHI